jgi:hypothetical protein
LRVLPLAGAAPVEAVRLNGHEIERVDTLDIETAAAPAWARQPGGSTHVLLRLDAGKED